MTSFLFFYPASFTFKEYDGLFPVFLDAITVLVVLYGFFLFASLL